MNKKIMSFLLTVAAVAALGSPEKSAGAAKGIAFSDDTPSPNPYVTSGLVAMWDGEWNAGFGLHDSESLVWKDLVGDNDMDVAETSSFGDNYLLNAADTDGAVAQRFADDALTVEVVMRVGGFYRYYRTPFVIVNYLNASTYRGIGKRDGGFTNGLIHSYVRVDSWRGTTTFNASFYLGSLWADVNTYFNGEQQSVINTTQNLGYQITHDATYVHAGQYAVEYYTIRLYNRALTEEEILHNYAVDAERFGL